MLISKIDFSEPKVKQALKINSIHNRSWEYYYKQYSTALNYMIVQANKNEYTINCQFMSFLFLFRHNIELMLKTNLAKNGISIPATHSLQTLAVALNAYLPNDFISNLTELDCNGEGDCFRYLYSKEGIFFFKGEEIKILPTLSFFSELKNTSNLLIYPIQSPLDIHNRTLDWELTFHTIECRDLGVVRTHYDYTLSLLLEGVIKGELNINDVYLPILFLIRHSIELAIKCNLLDLGNKLPPKEKYKIKSEHSIERLLNILEPYINYAIRKIKISGMGYLQETENYKTQSEILVKKVHNLDVNSQAFRFPFDTKGNLIKYKIEPKLISDTCSIYFKTDPYLTSAVYILAEHRCLKLGDDIMNEIFL